MTSCVHTSPQVRQLHTRTLDVFLWRPSLRTGLDTTPSFTGRKRSRKEEKRKEQRAFLLSLFLLFFRALSFVYSKGCEAAWQHERSEGLSLLFSCVARVCTSSMWRRHIVYNTRHSHRRRCALYTELCVAHRMSRRRKAPTLLGEGAVLWYCAMCL